ncbi:hypothetical protein [Cellulophaga baltica]|uniref:Uncharacterized protein n=1 Tax=Cellulophaga baltica TaxID=76594 RepID=A0A1G7FIA9_9FLAO|nr:hypothetical protein [Cellulophaga baltica]SDE75676.1 hypothetical protein SAMN04487992_103286 [Cellulophaga baltica]
MTNSKNPVFLFIALIILFTSCNKEDKEELKIAQISDITDIKIDVSEINMTDVNLDVSYINTSRNSTNVSAKIYYKLVESLSYNEVDEGLVSNLTPGKKYMVKAIVELNGEQKETEEVFFTTLGFYSDNLKGWVDNFENRTYTISNTSSKANFKEAQNLRGYIKVENDSLPLEKIDVTSNSSLSITIPENTQEFFKNDTEHIIKKVFSIVLFSGDYNIEIQDSTNGVTSRFWVKDTNHFTVYNKIPFIDSRSQDVIYQDCEGRAKIQFSFYGGFGGFPYSKTNVLQESEYKEIEITIRANEVDNNEIITFLDYSNSRQHTDNGGTLPNICNKEEFLPLEEYFSDVIEFKSMSLKFNLLILNLFAEKYPVGNYSITIKGTRYDNSIWNSNTYEFQIE